MHQFRDENDNRFVLIEPSAIETDQVVVLQRPEKLDLVHDPLPRLAVVILDADFVPRQ